MPGSVHEDAIIIDGLNISRFGPEVFEDMRRGGVTAANCTCSVWENFDTTLGAIGDWKRWFRQHDDLILQVFTTEDIVRAKRTDRTGIILGFQNSSAFEGRLEFVGFFKSQGVGIVQLTYNTQNLVGAWSSSASSRARASASSSSPTTPRTWSAAAATNRATAGCRTTAARCWPR